MDAFHYANNIYDQNQSHLDIRLECFPKLIFLRYRNLVRKLHTRNYDNHYIDGKGLHVSFKKIFANKNPSNINDV